MVKHRLILPQDISTIFVQQCLWLLFNCPFHTMSECILNKGDCFHVLSSVRVIVALLVEHHIQIILSRGDMKLVIPEIQWHQRHAEFGVEKFSNLLGEGFNVFHQVVVLGFLEQSEQKGSYFGKGLHFWNNIDITGIHRGDIVDFLRVFPHHLNNLPKRNFLFNDIVVLVDHNMISLSIVFHHKPDILCKPTPVLSLQNGELLLILPILFLDFFFEKHIIVKTLLSHNPRLVLVLVVGRYLGAVTDYKDVNVAKGRLAKDTAQ